MKTFFKEKPVRLKGKAKRDFRREVAKHFSFRCQGEGCNKRPPLLDIDGVFDVFTCGHVSHIKSLGSGGGDTLDNVLWKCSKCHLIKEHGLKFSKK